MGDGEQIFGGFGNVLAEVKGSVVPCEGELVTPDTWLQISNAQKRRALGGRRGARLTVFEEEIRELLGSAVSEEI